MENILFDKPIITDLQKDIDNGNYELIYFNDNFLSISIAGITIRKIGDTYMQCLPDGVDKVFVMKWKSTICKYFIKDMKAKNHKLYKIVKVGNMYYLLRLIDDTTEEFHNITILDKKYALVTVGVNGLQSTFMKSYKMKDSFNTIVESYEIDTNYDTDGNEESEELVSRTLFEDNELSN